MSNLLKEDTVPQPDALGALERVLSSRVFVNSNRLSDFLRYAVEQKLAGNGEILKEYTIGTNAYGRRADFDPSQDTIVRTEARRLRRKLKEYYEAEGLQDEVVIFFRSGSYVPVIHWRRSVEGSLAPNGGSSEKAVKEPSASDLWMQGDGVWVAVAPFSAPAGDEVAGGFAFGLGEEILHRLIGIKGVRVVAEGLGHASSKGTEGTQQKEAQILIGGTVRRDLTVLRATVRVTTASGLLLWSQRFDTAPEHGALVRMQEAIAATLLSRIAPRETIVQRFAGTPTETLYRLYSDVLAAEALLEESSHTALTAALRKFEELKAKAPEYPRLDCGIAQCCIGLAQRGGLPPDGLTARATAVARDLIARSPELPEAHSILGMALAQEWSWEAAETSFRAALNLGSQHSIHRQFGVFLLIFGRVHEAWEHLQIAQDIDPLSIRQKVSMGRFFYYSRWHTEATTYYSDVAAFGELPLEPAYFKALTLIQMREVEKALNMVERFHQHTGAVPSYRAGVAELYAQCGEELRARKLFSIDDLLAEKSPGTFFRKATLALALKEAPLAIRFLQQSLEHKEPELPWMVADPRFDGIRADAAYQAIAKTIFPA